MNINNLSDKGLLDLMTFLSPSFPVGGYAYSHAIEYAVEESRIKTEQDLLVWINAALTQGSGRIDGMFFKLAWTAVIGENSDQLKWVIERSDAMRGTSEMALESSSQGRAFINTVFQIWKSSDLDSIIKMAESMRRCIGYPIAVAVVSAISQIPLRQALLAYFQAFTANLVSAGIRLVPLGQVAGQRSIESLKPVVKEMAEMIVLAKSEDLGTAAVIIDWASAKHETQYTRLFRS
jgi:urease accessory protein